MDEVVGALMSEAHPFVEHITGDPTPRSWEDPKDTPQVIGSNSAEVQRFPGKDPLQRIDTPEGDTVSCIITSYYDQTLLFWSVTTNCWVCYSICFSSIPTCSTTALLDPRLYPPRFVGKIFEERKQIIASKPDIPEDSC